MYQADLREGFTANMVGSPHEVQMTTYLWASFVVPLCCLTLSVLSRAPQQKQPTLQASSMDGYVGILDVGISHFSMFLIGR